PIRRHLTMASNMPGSMSESIFPNNPPGNQQQIRGSLKPIPSHAPWHDSYHLHRIISKM
ncbi:hypothetical protein ACLOJK_035049, partial [Asimina triloba]